MPVILVGDIDRGGVIASLVGTKHVVAPADAARIEGFIVNKMRGDRKPVRGRHGGHRGDDGLARAGACAAFRSREPAAGGGCSGVTPLTPTLSQQARLGELATQRDRIRKRMRWEREFAAAVSSSPLPWGEGQGEGRNLKICVPLLPFISNFDDLDPLRLEPGVSVEMIPRGKPLPADADVILLPGSKATIADLEAFRAEGWDIDLAAHVRRGGRVLGLCGGFQMLGREISDPDGIEGPPRTAQGLGYLDFATALTGEKTLRSVSGTACGAVFEGYEMHIGESAGEALARPFLHFGDGRPEGAVSADGRVAGCYVHGLFASDAFRAAWLSSLGAQSGSSIAYEALVEQTLDELAAHLAQHIDMEALLKLAR